MLNFASKMCKEKPASFYVPTIMFSINMMEAARQAKVERYMFTSSIGVYHPAEIFNEDDVCQLFLQRMIGFLVGQKSCELTSRSLRNSI